jgi:two-component system LytT family sensor kinase
VFILVCVYSGRWLSSKWLSGKSILLFILLSITITGVLSAIGIGSWIYLSAYQSENFFIITPLFTIIFLLLGAGSFIGGTLVKQQINEAKILQRQKESELDLLISQLSPHFLFNTLNNIYGMSLNRPQQVPEHILKLSDLLRYSVYLSKKPLVTLHEELVYLRNYLDFERIRIGKNLKLTANFEEVDENVKITPMLFIIFIENAFKHSKNATGNPVTIEIILGANQNAISFHISNTYISKKSNTLSEESTGVGQTNALKRLDLLYPGRFDLKTEIREGLYLVSLKIKIK